MGLTVLTIRFVFDSPRLETRRINLIWTRGEPRAKPGLTKYQKKNNQAEPGPFRSKSDERVHQTQEKIRNGDTKVDQGTKVRRQHTRRPPQMSTFTLPQQQRAESNEPTASSTALQQRNRPFSPRGKLTDSAETEGNKIDGRRAQSRRARVSLVAQTDLSLWEMGRSDEATLPHQIPKNRRWEEG
jgi:hypothetical protein